MGKLTIKKVTIGDNDRITVVCEASSAGSETPDKHTIVSEKAPAESFIESLADLIPDVCLMAELPDKQAKFMKVIGVNFSYSGESNVMGAAIRVRKGLTSSETPLSFTTPNKVSPTPEEANQNADGKLTPGQVKKLTSVLKEAEKYVKGVKLQTDLFDKKK